MDVSFGVLFPDFGILMERDSNPSSPVDGMAAMGWLAVGGALLAYRDRMEVLRSLRSLPRLDGGRVGALAGEDEFERGGASKSSPSRLSPRSVFGRDWSAGGVVCGGAGTGFVAATTTTFSRGTEDARSVLSRVTGSGRPPVMTHRLLSYLVRMKFSILASGGTCPSARLASQYMLAFTFPHLRMVCTCSSDQASRSTDLTREMCVPMERWMPEQRMHRKTPSGHEAQRGWALRLQSTQCLFSGSRSRPLRTPLFLSATFLSTRDIPSRHRDRTGRDGRTSHDRGKDG